MLVEQVERSALILSPPAVGSVAVQIHFALFKGSDGYVLKPPDMLAGDSVGVECGQEIGSSDDVSEISGLAEGLGERPSLRPS